MPIYEFECNDCGIVFEDIVRIGTVGKTCPKCGKKSKKIFPRHPPKFNLKYNPQSDIVDWDGNTTRFYDEYRKMKAEGKNPRIPKLDGDG